MTTIPEELLQFKLTHDYISGADRISKIVAKNQFVIDLITASLLSVSSGTHTTGNNMFIDGIDGNTAHSDTRVHVLNRPVLPECVQAFSRLSNFIRRLYLKNGLQSSGGPLQTYPEQSIDPFIDNRDIKVLETLVAFVHFLISGQQNIISIDQWDDPTITKLYLVAMGMVKNDRVEALRTIY
ncbi:uncharacterized protein RHIMIDRAFT_240795 [Rhizopus microsporus ATCC 52813]|uniref:Uncharacterized protein n=1 Tax=Rhizopus microsporus ATCC 52813 TaxID=1340429 RepID=A0A2G4SKJ4_RHIZD|nr:uncharacterized protein RHIMIDRAFT_240795 [Rhizopus microsporus ATCC 52813]PHZ09290.1 hypothetical protein RHIMIDRAFT_240795 [Rhizopus microsporus ATCC 52813]